MSPWILIIDYILGIIMWTLIGRTAMNIFQREDSNFFFMKAFVKLTQPFKIFQGPDKVTLTSEQIEKLVETNGVLEVVEENGTVIYNL